MKPENRIEELQIKITGDGSHTLFLPSMNEHYHSHFGALTESKHIFIEAGLNFCRKESISILEVGFGTGLNALLTALNAEETHRNITYTTLEKYPLPISIIAGLNFVTQFGYYGEKIYSAIHDSEWGKMVQLTPFFAIHKIITDLTVEDPSGIFDLIYYDAFGPDKQPEMWSREVIGKIERVSHHGTVFVTYSAKGSLKRMLKEMDFEVMHLPGPPGKRVITRAIKKMKGFL